MAESSIKFGRKESFTVLYNSAVRDRRLSLKALGAFAIMTSLPDDWEYTVSGLAVFMQVGKDTVRSIINELENVGYLVREQSHGERGRFSGNVYILQDTAPPLSENTDNGESRQRETPPTGKPTQLKKDLTKERLNNTPIAPKGRGEAPAEVTKRVAEYAGQDSALLDAIHGLLENRRALRKPVVTLRAINGILKDLDNHSGGDRAIKLRLLDKSVTRNWLTVFPLKEDELPSAPTASPRREDGELDAL